MTEITSPLSDSAQSGAADSTGKATALLGPMRAFERWIVTTVSVSSTSSTLNPECRIYIGSESPSNLVNGTYDGKRDSDAAARHVLETGEKLVAVWTGADVGSVGTLSVRGDKKNGVQ